jgi:hypothetical protein
MIAKEMNSDSDELTCNLKLRISSNLIAIVYTNRKMLRDLIFLVCLILAKAVLRPIVNESLLIILLFIGNKIGLLPKINKKNFRSDSVKKYCAEKLQSKRLNS